MPLVPHHSETVDVSLTEIYEDTASPCVGVNSAVSKYKHVGNECTEPTIDHSKTGQQPFLAASTEYYSTSKFDVSHVKAWKSLVAEYERTMAEPTIDHSQTGQQPIQAPTTNYYSA